MVWIIQRSPLAVTHLVLIAILGLGYPELAVTASDTLDQNQSQSSGAGAGTRAFGTTPTGQTFTVSLHGALERESVYLTNKSANLDPVTVTILQVTNNGLPAIRTQVASSDGAYSYRSALYDRPGGRTRR